MESSIKGILIWQRFTDGLLQFSLLVCVFSGEFLQKVQYTRLLGSL